MAVARENGISRIYLDGRMLLSGGGDDYLIPAGAIGEAVCEAAGHPNLHIASPELEALLPGIGAAVIVPEPVLASSGLLVGREPAEERPAAFAWRQSKADYRDTLETVVEAFGLSPYEAQVADRLYRTGSAEAKTQDGLGYTATRNALASLRRKLGAASVAAAVATLLDFATERGTASDRDLADMIGLSPRQYAIASKIAASGGRRQLAEELGLSEAVVKGELAEIYAVLGVTSATELAAFISRARHALDALAQVFGREDLSVPQVSERTIERPGGRTVGYSRFGQGPRCVVIIHSSIVCRAPPTRLTARLVEQGYTVLAIDRPGFGPTSVAAEPGMEASVVAAATDLEAVCRAEGFSSTALLARSSGQVAVALAHHLGTFVRCALLVNPAPAIEWTPVDRGPLGAVKRRYARRPGIVRIMITLLLRLATRDRLLAGMRRSFAGSADDTAALADPRVVDDYLRAGSPLLTHGIEGYVTENVAWARGWSPPPLPGKADWLTVFGDEFVLHDPAPAAAYFAQILPDTPVRHIAGGHMIAYSKPDTIGDMLVALDAAEERALPEDATAMERKILV